MMSLGARWGILALLTGTVCFLMVRGIPLVRINPGAAYFLLAALLGVSSVKSKYEKELLNGAYQVYLIGLLTCYAVNPVQGVVRDHAVALALAACVIFLALIFILFSFPVLVTFRSSVPSQSKLVYRLYMAIFAALLVALAVGGAVPYIAYSMPVSAPPGWNAYRYALLFVAIFSGTAGLLLLPPIQSLGRPLLDARTKLMGYFLPVPVFWAAVDIHMYHENWTVFSLALITFAGTCVAVYRASQRVGSHGQSVV